MRIFIFLYLLLVFPLIANAETDNSIVVYGDSEVSVVSDEWQVNFDISIKEKSKDAVIAQYNKTKELLLKKLQEIKIKEDEVKTENFLLSPWYEWENNSNIKKGYQLSHTLFIKLDNFSLTNKLVSKLGDVSGVSIGNMGHFIKKSTRDSHNSKLLGEAFNRAQEKISALLLASQKKLKTINIISEEPSSASSYPLTYEKSANFLAKGSNASPEHSLQISLIPLDISLSVRVKVVAFFE